MFRLLISGSREWDQPQVLEMVLMQEWFNHSDLVIIHGDCPTGADRMARDFATKHGIPEERYRALWDKHGQAAGPIRNQQMVDTQPNKAIFFIRGKSKGTKHCLAAARKAGIPHAIYGDTT